MSELGDPQELFIINRCDTVEMSRIIGIVQAYYIAPGQTLAHVRPHDFFYRYGNVAVIPPHSSSIFKV